MGVGHLLNEQLRLGVLRESEELGAAVLADDGRVLEGTGLVRTGTTVEESVLSCQACSATMEWPPGECRAPETKSGWPPKPE